MTHKQLSNVVRQPEDALDAAKEVLKIAEWERCRLGQELHDGIEQELTGLGLLAEHLVDALREISSDQAELAAKVAKGISLANDHVHCLARELIFVAVAAEDLMSALSALAEATRSSLGDLSCTFVCPQPVSVGDGAAGMQICRIAQEAVTNALNHAEASHISIGLSRTDDAIRLEVQDDGVGIDEKFVSQRSDGLRIMRYRSNLIGGDLQIGRSTIGGTAVVCVVPRAQTVGETAATPN